MPTIMTTRSVPCEIVTLNVYEVGYYDHEYDSESDYNTHHRLFKYEKDARKFLYNIIESEKPVLIKEDNLFDWRWKTPQEFFGEHWRDALDKMTLDELNNIIGYWMFIAIHRVY